MTFMRWIDQQLEDDPELRASVEQALNELRIEQDLVALRERRGWSQSQLARRLGVSQPAIAKMESGRIRNLQLRTLVRAATAMGGKVRIAIEAPSSSGKRRRRPRAGAGSRRASSART